MPGSCTSVHASTSPTPGVFALRGKLTLAGCRGVHGKPVLGDPGNMIKKLFAAAIAAAAISVPLGGVASANTGNGNGIGVGGLPGTTEFGQTPGSFFNPIAKTPGLSAPGALGTLGSDLRTPGAAVKDAGPAADQGKGPKPPTRV